MHGLVLTAAGDSTRFGGGRSKVLLDLGGRPVLAHALETFRRALPELHVVVTVRAGDANAIRAIAGDAQVVVGGATRQSSVRLGVAALPDDVEIVFVHDAARPLVTVEMVTQVRQAVEAHGAAAVVAPVTDTVHGLVGELGTPAARLTSDGADRSRIAAAQTPQAARRQLLEAALTAAEAEGVTSTDEVSLLLRRGVAVRAVAGSARNVKITTPADLAYAAHLLDSAP